MSRPVWIAFDVNGTLLDPGSLLGSGRGAIGRQALDDAVMQAMADTLTGGFRPFTEYLRAALERALGAEDEAVESAMQRAGRLRPFDDAAAALSAIAGAGYRVAAVTNSAADDAGESLRAAGLDAHIELVVGADEVGAYKPHPAVYRHAAKRLGAAADEICLAAAHAWDVLGAMRAGWGAAWVGHLERRLLPTVEPRPRIEAPSLAALGQRLAAL